MSSENLPKWISYSKVSEEKDPCAVEGKASLTCLSQKNYDQAACQIFFDNYNNCKNFWLGVKRARQLAGITPLLPPVSERAPIKEKYKATGKITATAEG